ncbi:hypothetical protein CcaverHIS002_0402860 [Cutaneotrichosporon cavernicola]|uniref:Alpha-acetolactate decarboxylase n=1 Tax=Cutaneotrichosporon cavernicola TaxID=279322 RepID=A0AA48L3V9_9TREE|nr:uncharacterized protein CcaverHIS019_0402820 [Cutaneotrichosporon cavernicola]BEI83682.1 hypothetical protein CcaverHIS002_0402860 [Cutaneotrichosporon cavernicola]BEI91462.1 hypothetical protein CcaverHIS019_0402820 [Cutaneotrichosporon cavernicola]BEI99237.1 hypothetical protein CcaverHIS631_0402800 [Cutaneotrichosporon cavernicola]BEJ07015.1 hypothetical protein CcaverHIS641_0402840 [Cutaneotrichosporon cavernicola]
MAFDKPRNELYQWSVVSALVDGVASNGLPMSDLLLHGDHGLGTFRGMQGELIVLDGQGYQMRHDGTTRPIDLSPSGDITPFSMITFFSPTISTMASITEKNGVEPILAALTPNARNAHIAFRLDGAFKSITCRTAEGQCFEGEGLKDVVGRQVSITLGPARGTVIGFRSPEFLQGIAVAGVHMHFINEERTAGGHVLALETDGEVNVQVSELWRTIMDFPRDKQFNEAEMKLDAEGIRKAEG